MKSKLALTAVVALSTLLGCSSPTRTPSTGGTTGMGGSPASGGSVGNSGGTGSGGIASSGGATGQGGSIASGTGGTTAATSVGGASGGAGPAGGAHGGAGGGFGGEGPGGSTSAGGRTASGGSTTSGGGTGAGGAPSSGGVTGTGGATNAGGATGTGGATAAGGSTGSGPCDIYQAATTPCVAAHSTVRALYTSYTGPLYQLRKKSDSSTKDVLVGADGYVNIATHDSFCPSGTACTISIIYDQSPNKNDLTKSPTGTWLPNGGNEANADLAKITINGHTAHGIYVNNDGGHGNPATDVGYRKVDAKGVAKNDDPEAMYMVLDGTRYSGICCFDYGNAEHDVAPGAAGTMEAIYWGNSTQWGRGGGSGPWVGVDLEQGMFEGDSNSTPTNTTVTFNYVTAMLKGPSGNSMGLKAGNAQSGKLETKWNGKRPPGGFAPKKLEGSIILGTGGDGSDYGKGTFWEGVMTSGVPSDATDDLVQANIVAAGYGK